MVSSTKGILKNTWTFLMGEWGRPLGETYRAAKAADPANTSIFKFDWKNNYVNEIGKLEAAKASGATKSLWGKISSKFGVIFTAIAFGPQIFSAFKNEGIGEGLKETLKAAISLTAFAIGGVIVGMMGATGVLGFLATFLVPLALDFVARKASNSVLGESAAEQKAEIAKQEKELQKTQGNFDVFKNDPMFASLKKRFDERNNFNANPLCTTTGTSTGSRTVYSA